MQDITTAPDVIGPIEPSGEVLARFRSPEAMDRAIERLKVNGFDRGSLGEPEIDPPASRATPEAGSSEIATPVSMQQRRVLHTAVAGAIAVMVGALIAATHQWGMAGVGGTAVGLGIIVVIITELICRVRDRATLQRERRRAAEGRLVLAVRTLTPELQERATVVLRDAGGEILEVRPLPQPIAQAASSRPARRLAP